MIKDKQLRYGLERALLKYHSFSSFLSSLVLHSACMPSCFSPSLCNPMDCSPPGSSVHEILQARILEWVAASSSRWFSQPRDQTCIPYIPCIGKAGSLPLAPSGKPVLYYSKSLFSTGLIRANKTSQWNITVSVYLPWLCILLPTSFTGDGVAEGVKKKEERSWKVEREGRNWQREWNMKSWLN